MTAKALLYKAYLGVASQAWANLTDAQAATWREYAANHPVTNRLGRTHNISGMNWFVACNSHLFAAGDSVVSVAPTIPAPTGSPISACGVAVGADTATITLDTSPTGANIKAWIRAARVQSGRVTNVRNKLTEILITGANVASPIDIKTELKAELGTFAAGDWYHFDVRLLDTTTGLISASYWATTETVA